MSLEFTDIKLKNKKSASYFESKQKQINYLRGNDFKLIAFSACFVSVDQSLEIRFDWIRFIWTKPRQAAGFTFNTPAPRRSRLWQFTTKATKAAAESRAKEVWRGGEGSAELIYLRPTPPPPPVIYIYWNRGGEERTRDHRLSLSSTALFWMKTQHRGCFWPAYGAENKQQPPPSSLTLPSELHLSAARGSKLFPKSPRLKCLKIKHEKSNKELLSLLQLRWFITERRAAISIHRFLCPSPSSSVGFDQCPGVCACVCVRVWICLC